jgi:HK97 family phage prohead protease
MGIDIASRATAGAHITRSFDFSECEFRSEGRPDGFLTFEGVASVVDKPYTVRDQFGEFEETVRGGAFDKTLSELPKRATKEGQDVALFTNHDYRALPLATVSGGRYELWTTPDLAVRAFLNPKRPSVQEAQHAVADGDANQMSIGFTIPNKARDKWSDDWSQRTIEELKLHETSIVWRGASPTTTGAMRSLGDLLDLFPADGEYDEAEVRRAMSHLELLLPAPEVAAVAAAIAQRDLADRERLERKIADRPAAFV